MSFVIVGPESLQSVAADLAIVGSTISAASTAAAAPTTGLLVAGADEVSAAVAALFSTHGQAFQALSTQAAAFHDRFVQLLTAGAGGYAGAEAANVQSAVLDALNAPTLALLGRPLIGDGADGATVNGVGQPGGAGGLLYGNGGAGG